MKTSKTKINQRMRKKTNSLLAHAIYLAKKHNLVEIANAISVSTRKQARVNVGRLNMEKGGNIIVAGKVLGGGVIDKKMNIYALGFSKEAKEKLKKAGCKFETISDALKENKKLTGEILK